nr:Lrp/AsnC ligand binding domain-containing protein [Hephaestia mangrovi]
MSITASIEVQVSNERADVVDAAKAFFQNDPDVQQAYYATGGVSFVLVIQAPDMRKYEATTRMFAQADLVASYRSLTALDRVKFDTAFVVP